MSEQDTQQKEEQVASDEIVELKISKEICDFFKDIYKEKKLPEILQDTVMIAFKERTQSDMMSSCTWSNEWGDLFWKLTFLLGVVDASIDISEWLKDELDIDGENAYATVICGIQDCAKNFVTPSVAELKKKDDVDTKARWEFKKEC